MTTPPPFSCAETELLLGRSAVERIDRLVAAAPPLRLEQREQLRAVFASVHVTAREYGQSAQAA